MRSAGVVLATCLVTTLVPVSGQHAALEGVVTGSLSGNPLVGAYVHLLSQDLAAVTDADGWFRIEGVESGNLTIEIRMTGFRPAPIQLDIEVFGAVTVDLGTIALTPLVVELEPFVVEDTEVNRKLDRVGFYRRMSAEQGTFLTREEIERWHPTNTSDLLRRIPAFRAALGGAGNSTVSARGAASLRQTTSACLVTYYVDGVRTEEAAIDDVLVSTIEAIEVYAGPATIPPQFRMFPGNPNCGAVVIWKRMAELRQGRS